MYITQSTIDKVFKSEKMGVETMELRGYDLVKEYFVDSSGFGMPGELALTVDQFKKELTSLLKKHGKLNAKITGAGQFQVYVGLFKKVKKANVKIISPSVIVYLENGSTIVRLYDTDILKQGVDGSIVLYSGGYKTVTTKNWINKYLPSTYYLFQSNFEWFIHDIANEVNIPFEEGLKLEA